MCRQAIEKTGHMAEARVYAPESSDHRVPALLIPSANNPTINSFFTSDLMFSMELTVYLSALLGGVFSLVLCCSPSPACTSVGSTNESDHELSCLFQRLLVGGLACIAHPRCTEQVHRQRVLSCFERQRRV